MIIEVCSRSRALELAKTAATDTAVISITSLGERDVVFEENAHIVSILPLKFNDLKEAFDEEGIPYGRPLPKQEDFKGLKAYVDDLGNDPQCERLIIHCYEGISRSGAVARAVFEYRGRQDEIRTRQPLDPNPLVYELACRELGLF